jgi:ubiquinone/menaquinone biosynthesis C-methylase UbiE
MESQLEYGNWIRKKNLFILGAFTLGTGVLAFMPLGSFFHIVLVILFFIALISFLFPLYSYVMFSQNGGRLQEKVYNLIIQSLGADVKGKILDIGSGNGVLAVKIAQRHENAEVISIDYWGKDWEYSKSVCEKNAQIAKVESRVYFQKGDAAALGFASDTFDAATSNLTFHEVKSAADKRTVLQEALRVVKPGGVFAFVDYFHDTKYYGKASEFEKYLRDMKLTQLEYKPLQDMIALPTLLKHPKILGKVGIIYGRK